MKVPQKSARGSVRGLPAVTPEFIRRLAEGDLAERAQVAKDLYTSGVARTLGWLDVWTDDQDFRSVVVHGQTLSSNGELVSWPKLTVGIAVLPENFEKLRAANGSPPLADVPSDQDVLEFELDFSKLSQSFVHLDILTAKTPGATGAIARFLEKFGEGIQQVEIDVTDVDRATEILRTRFKIEPIYPATRAGANDTRVNFFLVTAWDSKKVLLELVEHK